MTPTLTLRLQAIGFAIEIDSIDGSIIELDAVHGGLRPGKDVNRLSFRGLEKRRRLTPFLLAKALEHYLSAQSNFDKAELVLWPTT